MLPRLATVAAFAFGLGVALPTLSQTGPFAPGANPISNQGWSAVAITPSDTTIIAPTRAIYNGGSAACNIAILPNGSASNVTFQNLQAGEILPVQAIKIAATNTTCTGIVAIY